MKFIQPEIDKTYRQRDGGITRIKGVRPRGYSGPYPFVSEAGVTYTINGTYWLDPNRIHSKDLIEEIVENPVPQCLDGPVPFRYSKEIIAWAKGTPVQMKRQEASTWEDMDPPGKGLYSWSDKNEYRIKPEALLPVTRFLVLTDKGISGGFPDMEAVDLVCKDRKVLQVLEVTIDQETHSVKHEWKKP